MYYSMKTLFLLYLVLPQTRGSSYLYINHLQPFLHLHESQIDATLASFKARLYAFIQERLRGLWIQFTGALVQPQQAQYAAVGAPPSLGDPVSGPVQLAAGLWRSYGPSLLASGAALLTQGAVASASSADKAWQTPASSEMHLDSSQPTRERRRKPQTKAISAGSGSFEAPLHHSSDSELRERRGRSFEEEEEPSDVEGYEVGASGKASRTERVVSWFGLAS